MLKRLNSIKPNEEYPCNLGQKWTESEDDTLLEELKNNINIETISTNHKRTTGGIEARKKEIAYKLYLNNISMEEIIEKTKLDDIIINQTIKKKQNNSKRDSKSIPKKQYESEIIEMKNEIKELKNIITELVEMMKAIYEFEDE